MARFGHTSVTKLKQLTIRFDSYKMPHGQNMRQHLRKMSNMITELKDAGHTLTDEQQVQAVIRSLPHSWEHMKIHLTYNESIKSFEDAMRHLELEEDRLLAAKTDSSVYIAGPGLHGASSSKRKRQGGFKRWKRKGAESSAKKPKLDRPVKGKRPFKKTEKVNCSKACATPRAAYTPMYSPVE